MTTCARLALVGSLVMAPFAAGCGDTPHTFVVIDNDYPSSATPSLVVYKAFWQAVSFPNPIPPGSSSDPGATVAASDNTAYALLAPGWDPASGAKPAAVVVLRSRGGFSVHLDNTLHIPVDDATFAGNCAAGSFLTQEQADFVTQRVFAADFESLHYDAASCMTTPLGDAGAAP